MHALIEILAACARRTNAPAPDVEVRRSLYGLALLLAGVMSVVFQLHSLDHAQWSAAASWTMALLAGVGVLAAALSRRQDQDDAFIDHSLPVVMVVMVLVGSQVAIVLALVLGALVMWPQRATLGAPIMVLNTGIIALCISGTIFTFEHTAGLGLLPQVTVAMFASTLCNLLISGGLHLVEWNSPRATFASCLAMLPLDALLALSIGAAATASSENPVFVMSLAVPLLLQRYGEYVQRRLTRVEASLQLDDLTGVFNRRYFWAHLDETMNTWDGRGEVGVLMIDIDNFKVLNDTHGHLQGDDALRKCAAAMQSAMIETAAVARYGGEEFGAIVRAESRDTVMRMADDLLTKAAEALAPWTTTVSIGVAFAVRGEPARGLTHRADTALYAAKLRGKNRWVLADDVSHDVQDAEEHRRDAA